METLKGLITPGKSIRGCVYGSGSIIGQVSGDSSKPKYEGAYEVIPMTTPQRLPTGNKTMTKDVFVLDIPYQEVSNLSGGMTATIG